MTTRTMLRRLNLDVPEPLELAELLEHAALTERTDRKYIAPVEVVGDLVCSLANSHRVLSIGGRRYTTYCTVYFDTEEFASVRAHVQQRRRRWKVRSRLYVEDQLTRVEVKTKDNRGNTIKVMNVSHPDHYGTLTRRDREFIASHLAGFPDTDVVDLVPAAEVRYTRATLSDLVAGTRVTIDWGLTTYLQFGDVWLDEPFVMVETKGPSTLNEADRALLDLGIRPRSFSKYVSAASSMHDGIASNDFASLVANGQLRFGPRPAWISGTASPTSMSPGGAPNRLPPTR